LQIAGRFWADAVDAYKAGNLAGLRVSGSALTGLLSDMDDLLGSHRAFLLGPVLQRARNYAGSSSDAAAVAAAAATAAGAGAASEDSEQLPEARQLHKSGSASSTDSGHSLQSSSTAVAAAAACSAAGTEEQQQQLAALYEWNARTQLTIWGTSAVAGDSEVSDYANKEWSGLIASFYLPRWQAWLARLEQDLLQGRAYDAAAWRLEVLMMTYRWISTGSTSGSSSSMQAEPMAVDDAAGALDADGGVTFGTVAAVAVGDVALAPRGDAVQLSGKAYERYGRLLAPGCSATAATAAAAVAAAAAGLAAAAAVPGGAPAGHVVAAAAAAAVVVGAAGAAAVAAAGSRPLAIAVDAVKA
jgi:hypothetical protein